MRHGAARRSQYNNDFYIIQSGRVEVWQEDTAEPIMIMVPGEFFGEEGILGLGGESEGGRVSHLAHSSSSVELVFISRAAFVEATTMHPELAQVRASTDSTRGFLRCCCSSSCVSWSISCC
eukprot:SAG11_NODE_253_length_11591_cov_15.933693_6_plen_121_part_00